MKLSEVNAEVGFVRIPWRAPCKGLWRAHIRRVLRKIPFIKPMAPSLAKLPPIGSEWIHEVKFDGWRVQIHVDEGEATIYSKNGADYAGRFRSLRPVLENIRVKNAIIDCELIACDETGLPNSRALMQLGDRATLCLWCFDLLLLNGIRLMPMPLEQRKAMLADLVTLIDSERLQFSGSFEDPAKLLDSCLKMKLEGIVSKRKESACRSGPTKDWLKIKTSAWRQVNRGRWELLRKT
jgi:bifunctional non-homologous end joining protein LigD